MKADEQQRQYRSNMTGQAVRMGIAEGAEAHLMDILTKMYGDTELACIREYSTNAYDSHVEAGQTKPIEVTLPTPYLPTLVIRDYGIGLNAEGIMELYSQYGASTKRDTNSAQGMLGIGCKSALAYTDQFTVVGFKHGVRTTVVVSRDEDGAATQTIVGEEHGTYEDGVEVTIPAKADNNMEEKARDFFRFWPKGSVVLVKGGKREEPALIGQDAVRDDHEGGEFRNIWLDDRTLLTNEVDEDLVVMGYVAYPLVDGDDSLFEGGHVGGRRYDSRLGRYVYGRQFSAVCFVDIGDVNFAPSRESLSTTKRTKDKLAELRKHVKDSFDKSVRDNIAAAADAKEAQELLVNGRAMGFDDSAKPAQWNGRDVLLSLTRGKKQKAYSGKTITTVAGVDEWPVEDCLKHSYLFAFGGRYSRKQGDRDGTLHLTDSDLTIFVGFDGKWLTNVKRAKLELWAQQNGVSLGKCVFVDKLTPDEKFWTKGWKVCDWADVEKTALPTTTTADGGVVRLKGSYDGIVDGQPDSSIPAHKIDTTKPLYYVHGNRWTATSNHAIRSKAISLNGATLIALPMNRVDKFKRDFPMAVELTEAAREAARKWAKTIDGDQVKAHAVQQHRAGITLKALKGEDFDDPSLNTLIRLANTPCTAYSNGLTRFGAYVDEQDKTAVFKLIENTTKKYPLVDWASYSGYGGANKEHLVLYINAAIAAGKE